MGASVMQVTYSALITDILLQLAVRFSATDMELLVSLSLYPSDRLTVRAYSYYTLTSSKTISFFRSYLRSRVVASTFVLMTLHHFALYFRFGICSIVHRLNSSTNSLFVICVSCYEFL